MRLAIYLCGGSGWLQLNSSMLAINPWPVPANFCILPINVWMLLCSLLNGSYLAWVVAMKPLVLDIDPLMFAVKSQMVPISSRRVLLLLGCLLLFLDASD